MSTEHASITSFRGDLSRRGGTGDVVILPDSAHTAALAAAALGCEVGAIANSLLFDAGGDPAPIRTWIDPWLRQHEVVWAAAGHPAAVFSSTYDELVAMTDAVEVQVD